MTQPTHYDAIVIGAGQSGGPLSTALAEHGWKTAIIERAYVGGTCINYGCTPTKTMIASARVAHMVRRAEDYGVSTGSISVDMATVRQRKRDMVEMFREGSTNAVQDAEGVDLIFGEASFSGEKTIDVTLQDGGSRKLTGDRIFINTGTRVSTPPIDGLDDVPYLDSTSIMEVDSVPEHLTIIGGGYVGVEFGQMFRRFGSEVTIIQRSGQLLSGEDNDIAEAIQSILEEDGISVRLNTNSECVRKNGEGGIQVVARSGETSETISGTHLLVAAGRTPNSDMLNLELTGVETDENGFIIVNERLETSVPGIWAMGEIAGQPAFTHISYDDFRVISANLLDGGSRSTSDRLLSYVAYIDPQLGRVGLSEKQAREEGHNFRIASMPMSSVARALETDETRGMMKAVIDADTDLILGATVLGVDGGEVMSIIQTAMMGNLPYQTLRDAPYSHPSLAESLNNLFALIE
jgi:pyruvate/2-oxoglutarate dehydrogenase complex dihydrolipoamide dehydrogenase (E3) component